MVASTVPGHRQRLAVSTSVLLEHPRCDLPRERPGRAVQSRVATAWRYAREVVQDLRHVRVAAPPKFLAGMRCEFSRRLIMSTRQLNRQIGQCLHVRLRPCGASSGHARAVGVAGTRDHFRHLKASILLNRGASLSEVQDVLGHSSPDTTKAIYSHYTPQFLRDVVSRCSASPAELVQELEAEQERRRGTA
jgi:integrase